MEKNKDINEEQEIKKDHECNCDNGGCENCHCDEHEHDCVCDGNCEHDHEHEHDENCDCGHDHDHVDPRYEYIVALEKDLKEAEDKAIRIQAEMINYRKRMEDEQMRYLKYANEDIVKNLLPIIDNFERAISLDDDNLEDELSKFLAGFKMIYKDLNKILESFEVKEIEALDKEFDANVHEAVAVTNDENKKSGVVSEVLQKGYKLKDKVIRPAMVKVNE